MRKEIFFAIFAGTLLGVIIALGIWRANSALNPEEEPLSASQNSDTQLPNRNSAFTISTPQENQVVTKSPLEISGSTNPDSWIAVSAEETDYLVRSDADGNFKLDASLIGGINQLVIAAFDEDGILDETTITVVYSTEFQKNLSYEIYPD